MKLDFNDLFEEKDGVLIARNVLHIENVVIQPGIVKPDALFGFSPDDYRGKQFEVIPHERYYEVVKVL